MIQIKPHKHDDLPVIEALLDRAFGPDRHKKAAYRLRDGVPPVPGLSFAAWDEGVLRGSIQFWPVMIAPEKGDAVSALLLGPLAVDPDCAGQGIGLALMEKGLEDAAVAGHRLVILVGDEPYYARAGFHKAGMVAGGNRFSLPGPVDPDRVLIRALVPGAADGLSGPIKQVAPPSGTMAVAAGRGVR